MREEGINLRGWAKGWKGLYLVVEAVYVIHTIK
jgi:hypothetical protein